MERRIKGRRREGRRMKELKKAGNENEIEAKRGKK